MENTSKSYRKEDNNDALDNAIHIVHIYHMVALSVVFLLGTAGNSLVIWFVAFKMKKTVNSVWFLSLAIADFTFSLFQPLEVTRFAVTHWPFGDFMCKLINFMVPLNMFSSVLQLTVISIDRCVCVVFPVWCRNQRTTRLALGVTLGIWILAVVCSLPFFIGRETGTDSDGKEYCKEKLVPKIKFMLEGMIKTRFVIFFVIPFIIIVSCYTVIIVRIRRNRMVTSNKPLKMITAVIISFFICWFPFHVCFMIWLYSATSVFFYKVNYIILTISISLAYANSFLNPFLYVFFGGDFKERFWGSILSALRKAFTEDPKERNSDIQTAQCRLSANDGGAVELSRQNVESLLVS